MLDVFKFLAHSHGHGAAVGTAEHHGRADHRFAAIHTAAAEAKFAADFHGGDLTDEIFSELGEIQKHIATTRQEIAALKPEEGAQSQFSTAKTELQEIVDATARATNDILSEAEKVSEISATLSEKLTDEQLEALGEDLGGLENAGTQIMLACGFQDLTGQRINKVVNTLIFVEEKVNKLVELWKIEEGTGKSELSAVREDDKRPDADLLNGPQSEGEGISQDDIDAMFA